MNAGVFIGPLLLSLAAAIWIGRRFAQQDRVPAGREFQCGMLELAVDVAPVELNASCVRRRDLAQAEMNFPAATAGVAGAAVNLSHQLAAVRQNQVRLCADGRAAMKVGARVSGPFSQRGVSVRRQRQQEV